MKITLSKTGPNRGGDIIALGRLLGALEEWRRLRFPEDQGTRVVLDLWIEYLGKIANHFAAANMGRVKEKSTFDLPFEKDFAERIKVGCTRCGQDIEQDVEDKTNICGSCADDLRAGDEKEG